MTTRLQRSALDYAIACLARGRRPEPLEQLRAYVDGDAYSRAVQEVQTAKMTEWRNAYDGPRYLADGEPAWVPESIRCRENARRIVRAWLALYLRQVRRGMVFERWCDGDGSCAWAVMSRTRPLYEDAPEHDPLVSPRQRRKARIRELEDELRYKR